MWSGLAEIEFEEDEGRDSASGVWRTFLRENVVAGILKNMPGWMYIEDSCGYGGIAFEEALGMCEVGSVFKDEGKGD